ncbi:branched-chain amino acid ABC transporter permease [Asanoa sp. NPDC050611]|uniref:branched-chain amino acid ABC transporter permease n=1 Tax=Asanoa sp. NPDC050611 TaxID=3157098 RepID=UPI0034118AD1
MGGVDYPQVFATGLTYGVIFALIALGYHLIYVSSGMLNFALGEQLAVAGLVVLSLTSFGVPFVLAVVLAVLAGAAFGAGYERLALRPAARMGLVGPLIASVGVSIVIGQGRVLIWGPNPRPMNPFTGDPNQSVGFLGGRWQIQSFWVIGLAVLAAAALLLFLRFTWYGRAWRATAQSPVGARLSGIDPNVVSLSAVAMASALVTIGGIAIAPIVLAGGFYALDFGVRAFAAAIIGGFSSTTGVLIGGLVVGLLDSWLVAALSAEWSDVVLYGALALALVLRPKGLFGREAVSRA